MTAEEKELNPTYKTTGGYLKVYGYREAWKKAYAEATPEEIELLKALPNFDADVFKEISGIDINKEEEEKVTSTNKQSMPLNCFGCKKRFKVSTCEFGFGDTLCQQFNSTHL